MVMTASGFVLLFLCGLAVCLFCWLSYATLSGTQRAERPAEDELLESAAARIREAVSAGQG